MAPKTFKIEDENGASWAASHLARPELLEAIGESIEIEIDPALETALVAAGWLSPSKKKGG